MRNWGIGRELGRGMMLLALFCALSIRIVVPAGYMPAVGSGALNLVICSVNGSRAVQLDLGLADEPSDQHKSADMPCAFAGASGAGILASRLAIPARISPALLIVPGGGAIAHLTIHRLAAPPPPPTAPPARA